jgi:hypothetical protein
MEHWKEEIWEVFFTKQISSLLNRQNNLTNPDNVADLFNNLFLLFTENFNLHQVVKEHDALLSKESFTCNFPDLKIIPANETGTKT